MHKTLNYISTGGGASAPSSSCLRAPMPRTYRGDHLCFPSS